MTIYPETTVCLTFAVEDGAPVLLSATNAGGDDVLDDAPEWLVREWEGAARAAIEDQREDGVVARWERAERMVEFCRRS